jgi:hypothetical protein
MMINLNYNSRQKIRLKVITIVARLLAKWPKVRLKCKRHKPLQPLNQVRLMQLKAKQQTKLKV